MAEDRPFLSRWSARKHDARHGAESEVAAPDEALAPGTPDIARGPAVVPSANAVAPLAPADAAGATTNAVAEPPSPDAAVDAPGAEPASALPNLDAIDAATDLSAFLRTEVPAKLRELALSRGWAADPAIRDFVEVADYAYDWNTPGGAPGYGPLDAAVDVVAMVERIFAGSPTAAPSEPATGGEGTAGQAAGSADVALRQQEPEEAAGASRVSESIQPGEEAVIPQDPAPKPEIHAAMQSDSTGDDLAVHRPAPPVSSRIASPSPVISLRRHGRGLPM